MVCWIIMPLFYDCHLFLNRWHVIAVDWTEVGSQRTTRSQMGTGSANIVETTFLKRRKTKRIHSQSLHGETTSMDAYGFAYALNEVVWWGSLQWCFPWTHRIGRSKRIAHLGSSYWKCMSDTQEKWLCVVLQCYLFDSEWRLYLWNRQKFRIGSFGYHSWEVRFFSCDRHVPLSQNHKGRRIHMSTDMQRVGMFRIDYQGLRL